MATPTMGGTLARVRRPEGYTLIEVVVALSVIAVGLLGVFHVLASTIYTNVDARNRAIATHFAERQLEVVRETDLTSLTSSEGNIDDDLSRRLDDDATWDLMVSDAAPGAAAAAPGSVLKAVTVTVRWKQGTVDESVSLSTLAHSNGIAMIRKQ